MCLIISSTGKEIDKKYIENGCCSHPHGFGLSYAKDKKLYNEKGFFKFEDFYAAYQKTIGNPVLLHMRNATSGLKNRENCHPFVVNDKVHFCHNGVISYFSARIKDSSDTFAFNENFLKPIAEASKKKDFFRNAGFKWFVQEDIGKGNKLAFIDNLGHIEIYNEAAGEWVDEDKEKNIKGEIWASNASYRIIKDRSEKDSCNWNSPRQQKKNGFTFVPEDFPENVEDESDRRSLIDPDPTETDKYENSDSEPLDITDIPAEELAEVDAYLETLNGVSAV